MGIKEGTIVPQEVTVALLKDAISSHVKKGDKRFLVDGFPRKMDQALTFEKEIVKSAFSPFSNALGWSCSKDFWKEVKQVAEPTTTSKVLKRDSVSSSKPRCLSWTTSTNRTKS